jgi:hypothetical protein
VNVLLVFDATEAAVDDTEVNDIPCGRNEVAGPASASDAACAAAICISKSRDDAFWGRRREEFDGLLSASGATGTPAGIRRSVLRATFARMRLKRLSKKRVASAQRFILRD